MNKLTLYFNTVKFLKPVQIFGRIFSSFKSKSGLIKLPEYLPVAGPSLSPKIKFIHHDSRNNREDILRGTFTFLNKTLTLGTVPQWSGMNTSLLWKFNLHYFNYLFLLNKNEQLNLCKNWINHNPVGSKISWHPYVVSLRLINWCKTGFDEEIINQSIYMQAAYLHRNLEYYHPANHFLENAKALIFAGLYFRGLGESGKWLKKGLYIYARETPRQVLRDGVYFERSIMYHAIILEGYLDLLNILPETENSFSTLRETTIKMLSFLRSATHPDGKIALFNDSTQEIAPSTDLLTRYTEEILESIGEDSSSLRTEFCLAKGFKNSGYFVYRDANYYFIIDGGAIGPDEIPAHAHADIFSYELSVKGSQFVVDSGVFEYQQGDMRDYVRGTTAHNTVAIDDKSQAEIWGSFRVGRRYSPENVEFTEDEESVLFRGEYRGYAKLIGAGLIHKRDVKIDKRTNTILVDDFIEGGGKHRISSFIHLHPGIKIVRNGDSLELYKNGCQVVFGTNDKLEITDGIYCPEFGIKQANKVIRIVSNSVPCRITYSFRLVL